MRARRCLCRVFRFDGCRAYAANTETVCSTILTPRSKPVKGFRLKSRRAGGSMGRRVGASTRGVGAVGEPGQRETGEADPFPAVLVAAFVEEADVSFGEADHGGIGRGAG